MLHSVCWCLPAASRQSRPLGRWGNLGWGRQKVTGLFWLRANKMHFFWRSLPHHSQFPVVAHTVLSFNNPFSSLALRHLLANRAQHRLRSSSSSLQNCHQISLFLHSNQIEDRREAQLSIHHPEGKESRPVSDHISLVKEEMRLFSFLCQTPPLEENWNENKTEGAFDNDTALSHHVRSFISTYRHLSTEWSPVELAGFHTFRSYFLTYFLFSYQQAQPHPEPR